MLAGVSDRILVLHHGRKIAEDAPDAVLSDPRVVEAYLGERYARSQRANAGAADTPDADVADTPANTEEDSPA